VERVVLLVPMPMVVVALELLAIVAMAVMVATG
jgi:hypothetical protein